jgi:hypothetical protein
MQSFHPHRLLAALVAAFVTWPDAAWACAVCLSATEATRDAYYGTTVLLILLPFVLAGFLIFWLRRVARAQRRALDSERLPAAPR